MKGQHRKISASRRIWNGGRGAVARSWVPYCRCFARARISAAGLFADVKHGKTLFGPAKRYEQSSSSGGKAAAVPPSLLIFPFRPPSDPAPRGLCTSVCTFGTQASRLLARHFAPTATRAACDQSPASTGFGADRCVLVDPSLGSSAAIPVAA